MEFWGSKLSWFPLGSETSRGQASPRPRRRCESEELGAPLLLHAELLPEHREGGRGEDEEEKGEEAVEITDLESWAVSRPEEMEVAAVREVVAALERVVSARKNISSSSSVSSSSSPSSPSSSSSSSFCVHIAHVAAPSVLPLIARAKRQGLPLSAETCPHYLGLLDPSSPPERRGEGKRISPSLLKCAPPLRADVPSVASKKLWAALEDGTLDSVASDHSPSTPEMKRNGRERERGRGRADESDDDGDEDSDDGQPAFARAWGGISGLQFLLPSTWSSSPQTPRTIEEENTLAVRLHRWLSSAPAALAGLSKRKGAILGGFDADFVAWKPGELADVSFGACRLRHCENSPFVDTGDDLKMRGRVVATFLRGQLVFREGDEEEEEKGKGKLRARRAAAGGSSSEIDTEGRNKAREKNNAKQR